MEAFFGLPEVTEATLSPDGTHLAYLTRYTGDGPPRLALAVVDLTTRKLEHEPFHFDVGHMTNVHWVNDRRLVFQLRREEWTPRQIGEGLFAIDRDGSNLRELIRSAYCVICESSGHIESKVLPADYYFDSVLADGSDDVLVFHCTWDQRGLCREALPYRLNTRNSGKVDLGRHAPDHAQTWLIDWAGEPRYVMSEDQGVQHIHARDLSSGQWSEIARFPFLAAEKFSLWQIGFDGEAYVIARKGKDTNGLYRMDAVTHAVSDERLVDVDGFDFHGALRRDWKARRVLGVEYRADAFGVVWTDPAMAAVQKRIDALLPATINRIGCRRCLDAPFLLVKAVSDRQPELTLVYDRARDALLQVGASRPAIHARQMGVRSFERIRARDGMEIPTYVTRPAGAKGPTPAVVMVHGGPYTHGADWEWEAETQFLASRGYTVVEPAFRGSTGYGTRLFEGGLRQWGLAMQDDVADAAQWAIHQGLADPSRIAIGGASYGGYATLMGLIRDPKLFRSGFEWVGVTDINLLFSLRSSSDMSDEAVGYTMPEMVGDPEKLQAQFAATSPIRRAAEIRQPVLLAYGGLDHRVPSSHGTAFREALQATNRDVEWVFYPNEGHGWHAEATNFDFWTRVEKFLARTLAPAP